GDDAVAIVEDAAGVLRATYFSIADGSGAGASTAAAAGTALQTPATNELLASSLFISAPFAPVAGIPTGIRLFLVPDGTDPSEPVQRVDIYPAQGAAGNVSSGIMGFNAMAVDGEAVISSD